MHLVLDCLDDGGKKERESLNVRCQHECEMAKANIKHTSLIERFSKHIKDNYFDSWIFFFFFFFFFFLLLHV